MLSGLSEPPAVGLEHMEGLLSGVFHYPQYSSTLCFVRIGCDSVIAVVEFFYCHQSFKLQLCVETFA